MRFGCLVLIFLFSFPALSQSEEVLETKQSRHFIGLQSNQLLRQILNFGGANTAINNPYLLTYSVNSIKTGVGVNFGLGYTLNQSSNNDAVTPRETTAHDMSFRIGVEKKFSLGKHWLASYGGDILISDASTKTETRFAGSASPITTTEITSSGMGFGPRVALNFSISEHILVGTEASYYYISSTQTQKVTGQQDISLKPRSFSLALPTVIYLIIRI